MYQFLFVKKSSNQKTGDIPQVYTKTTEDLQGSCPTSCPLKNVCYAKCGFYTRLAWQKAAMSLTELTEAVQQLKKGTLIRHNVAGDIAVSGTDRISWRLLGTLTSETYKDMKAYTYTHCNINNEYNTQLVKAACENGFTVNFSCESLEQVKKAVTNNVPCVLTVESMDGTVKKIDGINFLKCPAQSQGKTCKNCGICQNASRKCVVVFEVHGTGTKKAKESNLLIKL